MDGNAKYYNILWNQQDFIAVTYFQNFSLFFLQFFSIIVFGCISSSGWFFMQNIGKEVCVLNMDSSACHFSTMVGIVAFIASIGFLVGEWYANFFLSLFSQGNKNKKVLSAARHLLESKEISGALS